MDKRLKKNFTIIATPNAHLNPSGLFQFFDLSPKMVAPSKWLEMGFELIKKMK